MNENLLQRLWGLRKPRRLTSVVLRRLRLSHLVTIERSGVRMKFFPAMNMVYMYEDLEFCARDIDLYRRWLRSGDVMVDCGANVGQMALVAASVIGPAGTVYAIEAHPTIFRYLSENVALNDARNIRLLHAAVGEREGSILFSDQHADDGNHIVTDGQGIAVKMLPVDTIVPAGTSVRLLKLDVEGYEKFVLEGAARVLRDTHSVYFESSDSLFGRYGYTCRDMFDLLEREGFVIHRYEADGVLARLPAGYHSVNIENLVAVRSPGELARVTGYTVR